VITELLKAAASWPSLMLIVLTFGFAPGFCLRLIVLAYPRNDPRRAELVAEIYAVPRIQRPFWVAEQLEVALFEGLPHRLSGTQPWVTRQLSNDGLGLEFGVFRVAGIVAGIGAGLGVALQTEAGLRFLERFLNGLVDGPVPVLVAGLVAGLMIGFVGGLNAGFRVVVMAGLAAGLGAVLVSGLGTALLAVLVAVLVGALGAALGAGLRAVLRAGLARQ
jgi:hypothetical protein